MRGVHHWRWHLDEMYVKINGEMHYLWRAVDHEGKIFESFVTKTRDKQAALTFMKKALKRHGNPETITTDGLQSYRAAMNKLGNSEKQETGHWANNRVENSHLPFRRRERAMLRFRKMKSLQKFVSIHANLRNHFNQERHLVSRQEYQLRRSAALAELQSLIAYAFVDFASVRQPRVQFSRTSGRPKGTSHAISAAAFSRKAKKPRLASGQAALSHARRTCTSEMP